MNQSDEYRTQTFWKEWHLCHDGWKPGKYCDPEGDVSERRAMPAETILTDRRAWKGSVMASFTERVIEGKPKPGLERVAAQLRKKFGPCPSSWL
jgi:hypothetical protein